MAHYKVIKPSGVEPAAQLWQDLTDLLAGSYSVEVLPDGESIVYRVWFEEHCDITKHEKL